MRGVADGAALQLGFVLVNEGSLLIGVAFVADLVLPGGGAQLVGFKSAVGIVTVVALEQSFVDAVMKWPGELRADIQMAAVAKFGRRIFQQALGFFGMVRGMAIDAGNAALQVSGAARIVLLVTALVAIQAARADLCGRGVLKGKDFRDIPAAIHMFLAGPVACLATVPLRTGVRIELGVHRGGEVRGACKVGVKFLVAGLAGIRADVQSRVGGAHVLDLLRSRRLLFFVWFGIILRPHVRGEGHREREKGKTQNPESSFVVHAAPPQTR